MLLTGDSMPPFFCVPAQYSDFHVLRQFGDGQFITPQFKAKSWMLPNLEAINVAAQGLAINGIDIKSLSAKFCYLIRILSTCNSHSCV